MAIKPLPQTKTSNGRFSSSTDNTTHRRLDFHSSFGIPAPKCNFRAWDQHQEQSGWNSHRSQPISEFQTSRSSKRKNNFAYPQPLPANLEDPVDRFSRLQAARTRKVEHVNSLLQRGLQNIQLLSSRTFSPAPKPERKQQQQANFTQPTKISNKARNTDHVQRSIKLMKVQPMVEFPPSVTQPVMVDPAVYVRSKSAETRKHSHKASLHYSQAPSLETAVQYCPPLHKENRQFGVVESDEGYPHNSQSSVFRTTHFGSSNTFATHGPLDRRIVPQPVISYQFDHERILPDDTAEMTDSFHSLSPGLSGTEIKMLANRGYQYPNGALPSAFDTSQSRQTRHLSLDVPRRAFTSDFDEQFCVSRRKPAQQNQLQPCQQQQPSAMFFHTKKSAWAQNQPYLFQETIKSQHQPLPQQRPPVPASHTSMSAMYGYPPGYTQRDEMERKQQLEREMRAPHSPQRSGEKALFRAQKEEYAQMLLNARLKRQKEMEDFFARQAYLHAKKLYTEQPPPEPEHVPQVLNRRSKSAESRAYAGGSIWAELYSRGVENVCKQKLRSGGIKEEAVDDECTFHPKITAAPGDTTTNKGITVYSRLAKNNRKNILRKLTNAIEDARRSVFTFVPKVNSRHATDSRSEGKVPTKNVSERLHKDATTRDKRLTDKRRKLREKEQIEIEFQKLKANPQYAKQQAAAMASKKGSSGNYFNSSNSTKHRQQQPPSNDMSSGKGSRRPPLHEKEKEEFEPSESEEEEASELSDTESENTSDDLRRRQQTHKQYQQKRQEVASAKSSSGGKSKKNVRINDHAAATALQEEDDEISGVDAPEGTQPRPIQQSQVAQHSLDDNDDDSESDDDDSETKPMNTLTIHPSLPDMSPSKGVVMSEEDLWVSEPSESD